MTSTPTSKDAIIVVDVQNDFCEGGALEVTGANSIIPIINAIVPRFRNRVFTRDWHPPDHCSFSDNPRFVDMSWPVHCVANTRGAEYHPELNVPEDVVEVNKATEPGKEAYSDFEGTGLGDRLRAAGVSRVFVCGLATDYCVKNTALDALREGFDVVVLEDACRAVDVPPGTGAAALDEMRDAGAVMATSEDIVK